MLLNQEFIDVILIDYQDLNRFIMSKYDLKNFNCELESYNDTYHMFDVSNSPLDKYGMQSVKEYCDRCSCEHYGIGTILNDLCVKGHIKKGRYLINISW